MGFDGPKALAEACKMPVFRAKLFDIKTLTAITGVGRANSLILNEGSSELSQEKSLTLYLSRL
jgi:hypothetical protein